MPLIYRGYYFYDEKYYFVFFYFAFYDVKTHIIKWLDEEKFSSFLLLIALEQNWISNWFKLHQHQEVFEIKIWIIWGHKTATSPFCTPANATELCKGDVRIPLRDHPTVKHEHSFRLGLNELDLYYLKNNLY